MPQAVGVAFAKAAFFLVSAGVPIAAIDIGLKIVGVVLLSTVTSKLFGPKIPDELGFQARDVMSRTATQHRQIVYGQAAVSGPIIYNNLSQSGTDGVLDELWYVIAIAQGESEDLVEVRFDGDVIPKADISWTAGTGGADGTGTGAVSTTEFVGESSETALNIFYYLGDDAQPVCGPLNTEFLDIDTTHRGRGVTHLVCKLTYNRNTEDVWKNGPPNNIRAIIKGRKIYDPRLDSTNGGTGSHRYTDSSTWAYSDNPALCVSDYLTQIMGVDPASRIDWPSIADAADDCDVSVTVPSGTETRFTCNGALSLGSTHKDNLDALVGSCDGRLSYTQGQWRLRASVWEASSVTITEDDLAGPVEVRGAAPKAERFNLIRGVFIDPDRDYEPAEFPHVESASYQTRDNGEIISYDLQLPMTNSRTMAERIAYRVLEQGDNQTTVNLTTNLMGAQVRVGDIFTADLPTYGWTDGGNEIPYSEDFANAAWGKARTTTNRLTSIADPFGGEQAYRVIGDGTAGNQRIEEYTSFTQSTDTDYTFSVYARKRDYDYFVLLFGDTSVTNYAYGYFNILNGEVGTLDRIGNYRVTDAGIEKVGNGWHRCWLTARPTSAVTGLSAWITLAEDDGDNTMPASTNGTYFFGAQFEEGVGPTLYKRTTGTTVTATPKTFRCIDWSRNADGSFQIVGREDDSGDYVDPLSGEYASETTGTITLPADLVPPPDNLTATSAPGGVNLEWDEASSRLVESYEIYAADDDTDNDRDDAQLIATVSNSPFFHSLPYQTEQREYWIRAKRGEIFSTWEPTSSTTGVVGTPAPEEGSNLVTNPDLTGSFGTDWDDGVLKPNGTDTTISMSSGQIVMSFTNAAGGSAQFFNLEPYFQDNTGLFAVDVELTASDPGTISVRPAANDAASSGSNIGYGTGSAASIVAGTDTYRLIVEHSFITTSAYWQITIEGDSLVQNSTITVLSVNVRQLGGVFVSAAGFSKPGLVPAPTDTTAQGKVLTDAGAFEALPAVSSSQAGIVPAHPNDATEVFLGDGTYGAVPGAPAVYGVTSTQAFTDQTWTDVTGLTSMTLETGETYNVQLDLYVAANTSPFEFRFVFSNTTDNNGDYNWLYATGASGTWDGGGIENSVEDTTGNQTSTALTGSYHLYINMRFKANATTGGTFKMQARRGDSGTANQTAIFTGSAAKVTKVS